MQPISVTLALEALEEQVEVVATSRESLSRQMGIRDELIRDAIGAGLPYRRLVRITGLSRDRLYTIVNSPPRGV